MRAPTIERRRLVITGVVQGVGFRPFVHRLANRLHLSGTVTNTSARVVIDVVGMPKLLDRFQQLLVDEAPPLATIESLIADRLDPGTDAGPTGGAGLPSGGFTIIDSTTDTTSDGAAGQKIFVAPDTAACEACRAELHDPTERRHRYPFISCTDCGPRFTIIDALPYDRPNTTMAPFPLCPACHDEYHDPTDRRFHAQPIGCHDCGPTLSFRAVHPRPRHVSPGLPGAEIAAAATLVRDGGLLVVKGVGGFQLACDAGNAQAVAAIRRWKQRPDKPLALLVADLDMARRLVEVDDAAEALLSNPARPIVLCRRLDHSSPDDPASSDAAPDDPLVCEATAPGQPRLGVMLPPSPMHELLAGATGGPMVLTSGNHSGSPMCFRDDQLDNLLAGSEHLGVAVGVLTHDRPIAVPCDDSVVRVGHDGPLFIRRARGYAPTTVAMVAAGPPILAVGGQLKNTFCLAGVNQGWVSQHIGDMDDLDTVHAFGDGVGRFERFHGVDPEMVVVDAHPDHGPRSWARRHRPGLPVVEVQHHHAHVASVLAEHAIGFDEPVIGVAFDGTGYGPGLDGEPAVWGGEFLAVTGRTWRRIGHLAPVSMPGGDAAVINPYRVALAHLRHSGIDPTGTAPGAETTEQELAVLDRQLETGFGCLPNSSMGRLFDAVGSIVGLRHRISYEAQGAIELELAATRAQQGNHPDHRDHPDHPDRNVPAYRFRLDRRVDGDDHPVAVADPRPVLAAIVDDVRAEMAPEPIALGFHRAVVDLVVEVCTDMTDVVGTTTVALSGGVFQNALLADETASALRAAGFEVLVNRLVPPNDGGLALGQAYVGRHHGLSSHSPNTAGATPCV